MTTQHPEEMKKLLKYGTPSDELIKLSNQRIELSVKGKKARFITFPESLNKAAGQRLLFNAVKRFAAYKITIPELAFNTFSNIVEQVHLRRADATTNVHMVAEALCFRAAVEFKAEILFSFDSINAWISEKYGKTLGYQTIRKALELLEEKLHITVREWGVRGNRRRCTKIHINFDYAMSVNLLPATDNWIFDGYAAYKAVESRESFARQDVLEVHIQRYLAKVADENAAAVWEPVPSLFNVAGKESLYEEFDVDRFLGELVSTVQEAEPDTGRISTEFLRLLESSQSRR